MHENHLRRAIALALDNVRTARGGPFGAVIVQGGQAVAEGTNLVTLANDPTAHAEVVAIRRACEKVGRFDLRGCDIYASCEPCPMCLAAIYWARLDRLWFAATRADAAEAGFDDQFFYDQIGLPAERRSLPATMLLRDEGKAPLKAWKASDTKVRY
jgi:tRNA(Arg) A34 adenosine deaminase TadA